MRRAARPRRPPARPGGSRPSPRGRPRAARGSAPWSPDRRWISRPGVWKASASGSPWWRSLQANISTAIEAPPRPTPARATGLGPLDQPLQQDRAAGREQHHRHDQVGAAAVVLLGHAGDVVDPLLIGGDRLVLDPVVGGEVAVDQRDHGGHRADRLHQRPRAGPSCRSACAAPRSRPASPRSRRGRAGPRRAAAPPAAAAGPAAAPPSPRPVSAARAGRETAVDQPGRQLGLGLRGNLRTPDRAYRRGPVGRPMDQQAVAQSHPAESQLLTSHVRTIRRSREASPLTR